MSQNEAKNQIIKSQQKSVTDLMATLVTMMVCFTAQEIESMIHEIYPITAANQIIFAFNTTLQILAN